MEIDSKDDQVWHAIAEHFAALWGGDDAASEAELFVCQLKSLAKEIPAHTRKTSKEQQSDIARFRRALTKAAHYATRLGAVDWLSLAGGNSRAARVLLDEAHRLESYARTISSAESVRADIQRETREQTLATGVLALFRTYGLPARDSGGSSFAINCIGQVFDAAGIDSSPDAIRGRLRRTVKLFQK